MERTVRIANEKGLHARASARFVKTVEAHSATVMVRRADGLGGGEAVSGASILDLLMLAAEPGTELVLKAEGKDNKAVLDALQALVERNFDEPS